MRFDVLDGKTEFEAQVSDHYIVVEGVYATFNILGQCQNYGKYYNNGFKMIETDAQFADRLFNKTIPVMQELYDKGVRVFLLQEAPALIHLHGQNSTEIEQRHYAIADEFYTRLQEALPQLEIKNAPYSKSWGELDSSGLLTLVDKQWSDKLIETTMDMKSNVSEKNQDRFQSFELYLHDKAEPIKIANFHADYSSQEGTKADIKYFVSKHYVIGGDFNLIELPDTGVNVIADKTESGLMPVDTYDAIFFGDPNAQYIEPNLVEAISLSEVLADFSSPIFASEILIEDSSFIFHDVMSSNEVTNGIFHHDPLDYFNEVALY